MKTTLASILWKKEKKHWNRTFKVFAKFNNWFFKIVLGLILASIGTVVHYAFALMSTSWNSLLWLVARKRFKLNLQRMALTV